LVVNSTIIVAVIALNLNKVYFALLKSIDKMQQIYVKLKFFFYFSFHSLQREREKGSLNRKI